MDELILRLVNSQLLSLSLNKVGRKSRSRRADVAAAAAAANQQPLAPGQLPPNNQPLNAAANANPTTAQPAHYMYNILPQQQQLQQPLPAGGRAPIDPQQPQDDDDGDGQPADSSMLPHSSSDSQIQTVDITGRRQTHAGDVMLDAYATELEHGLGRSALFTRLLLGFGASQQALNQLTLSHNGLDGSSMAQLAGALQTNRSVRMLSVANNKIGSEGVKALCDCLRVNTAILSLDLSNNSVMDEGGEYLAGLVHVTRTLTSLDLTNCSIYNTGTKSIIGALRSNHSLATLHLTKNYALVDGAALMGDVLVVNRTLTRLDLTANYIYAEGCKELCKGLQRNSTLTELHLAGNEINNHGCKQLSKALATNSTLQILLIHDNLITHVGAKDLAAALRKNTSLTLLHLCDNQIGVKGAEFIAKALKGNRVLQRLHLAANDINAQGIRHLAKALKTGAGGGVGGIERVSSANDGGAVLNGGGSVVLAGGGGSSALIELNLSWNRFGSDGAKYIGVLLKDNATLKELSIAHNKMMDEGIQAIMEQGVVHNRALEVLDLSHNRVRQKGMEVIAASVQHNNALLSVNVEQSAGQQMQQQQQQLLARFNVPDERGVYAKEEAAIATIMRRNLQQHVVQQKQALLMAMHQRTGAGSVMQSVFRGSSIGDVSVLREVWEYCFGPKGDGSAGFQPFNPYSHMGNHDPRRPAHQ